jgi:predicted nucleotidyltransferase
MAKKPVRRLEYREVTYHARHWRLLQRLRKRAMHIMKALENAHLETIVHGSVARGDVSEESDIDVFIPSQASSFLVESALERARIPVVRRLVLQATPNYAMKAYVEIDERTGVSFSLMRLRRVEREFYKFGGEISIDELNSGLRVAGVDKRLMFIEPTEDGHRESSVLGNEEQIGRMLGISVETVLDRVHTLLRRDKVGRTGVFIKEELPPEETFEMALKRFVEKNPAVRRRLMNPC